MPSYSPARWTRASALVAVSLIAIACTGQLNSRGHRDGGAGEDAPWFLDDEDAGFSPFPDPPDDDAAVWLDDAGPTPIAPHDAGRDAPIFEYDASSPPDGTCTYPTGATGRMTMGAVISPYRWTNAYREDGTRIAFDLERFHCDPEWDAYTAILFVVGTGWCPNCPAYLRDVAAMDLAARGTLVVYLESQNSSYESCTSAEARSTVDRVIGSARGLRIGDGENSDRDAIGDQTGAVPAGYFVRRRDMRVLANENDLGTSPPWEEMASSPELDWVTRLRGGGSGVTCTEETLEPNDTRSGAAAIAPGTFTGGICGADDDFFRVSIPGAWQLDLRFRHRDGDIDLFVLDDTGRIVVTSDSADDDESVSYTGPATIRILGYEGATSPYSLTLVAR